MKEIDLQSYLESSPNKRTFHGTLSDGESGMGFTNSSLATDICSLFGVPKEAMAYQNPYRPSNWYEKARKAITERPHISAEIVLYNESDLWSPVGLQLSGGKITDIGDFSRVNEDGVRVLDDSSSESLSDKLKHVLDFGEIVVRDPIFSGVYLQRAHPYIQSKPEIEKQARDLAQEHGLKFVPL